MFRSEEHSPPLAGRTTMSLGRNRDTIGFPPGRTYQSISTRLWKVVTSRNWRWVESQTYLVLQDLFQQSPWILTGRENALVVVGRGGRLCNLWRHFGDLELNLSQTADRRDLIFFLFTAWHGPPEDLQLPPEVRCWSGGGGLGSGSLRWGIYPGVQWSGIQA